MTKLSIITRLAFSAVVLLLVLGCASCSSDERPCDVLCQARKLDEELAGEGKIFLAQRDSHIDELIIAFRNALPVDSGTAVTEIQQRIQDLEFEKELVDVLGKAFGSEDIDIGELEQLGGNIRISLAAYARVYAEAALFAALDGSVDSLYERVLDPSVKPDPELVSGLPSEKHLVWILTAVNAHPDAVPQWFNEDVVNYDGFTGYNLSHQFIALYIQQYVWSDYDFGPDRKVRMDELARRIAEEESMDCATDESCTIDLYAERISFLFIGGYADLIQKEWVQRLIEAQLDSGLWPFYSIGNEYSWHTTNLALNAVSGYQIMLQRGEEGRFETFSSLDVNLL